MFAVSVPIGTGRRACHPAPAGKRILPPPEPMAKTHKPARLLVGEFQQSGGEVPPFLSGRGGFHFLQQSHFSIQVVFRADKGGTRSAKNHFPRPGAITRSPLFPVACTASNPSECASATGSRSAANAPRRALFATARLKKSAPTTLRPRVQSG